jgi:hypothetical protein
MPNPQQTSAPSNDIDLSAGLVPQQSAPASTASASGSDIDLSAGLVPASQNTAQQVRYVAPGQGIQEFTKGSTDEQQFLQKFPTAKVIPGKTGTYQRALQPGETVDTEAPAVRAARETKQGKKAIGQSMKTAAVIGGSIAAPELLPFVAPELAAGGGVGALAAESAATGVGAGAGTVAGQVASGEDPLTAESLKETGTNALEQAAGHLVIGGTGKLISKAVDSLQSLVKPGVDVADEGSKLVSQIGGGTVPGQEQVAKNVADQLGEAEADMHAQYEAGLSKISEGAKDVPVSLQGSALQETAEDLLTDSKIPTSLQGPLKGVVPDSDKLIPFLKTLTGDGKAAPVFSWDEVEATRQAVGGTIRKLPYDSPIRPDLIKIRSAIDETLQQAALDAGKPELSAQIKNLRAGYADTISKLQETAIKTLADKSPNSVADILLNKQRSIQNVKNLRSLIGPENMKQVEGSILGKLLQKSATSGEVNGKQLLRSFNGMGPDVQHAIWGDNLPQVRNFMDMAAKNSSKIQPVLSILAHYGPGTYLVGDAVHGLINGRDPQKVAEEFLAGTGALLAGKYGPQILEKYGPQIGRRLEQFRGAVNAATPAALASGKAAIGAAQTQDDSTEEPQQ